MILGNCRLQCIQSYSKFSIGWKRTQRGSAQPYGIDSFVYRNMPFFRRVHRPAFLNSVMLCPVARNAVPCQLDTDEVRHHAAAGEVPAGILVIASQVGKPPHRAALHGYGSRANRIRPYILVERGADEIRNNADGTGRWSD